MANIELIPLIDGLSGKVGSLVFRKRQGGTTVMSAAQALPNRTSSEKQLAQQERFKQAGEYAREAADIVPFYAEMAEQTMKSAYAVAFSDWLHAPVIHRVEQRPGQIDIYVQDNVRVDRVYVTITNEDGVTLEQGQAVPATAALWQYETEVPGNVLVEAFDLAGNVTRYEAGQER